MNAKIALTAIAIISALALVVAPAMVETALAKKTVTEEECLGDPQEREECPGESGSGKNPNRLQQECSVTGGGGDPVRGQEKKLCD